MSDEKLGQTFYYMHWKNGLPTTLTVSPFFKIKKENCFEILPIDLVGLLEKERERSRKLVEAFEHHLNTIEDINAHIGFRLTQPLIKAREKLKEYEKEKDLKEKHERVLEALMFAESILEKQAESYEDGPGMFIARQFDDRIHEARKALIKIEELKR